MPIFSNIESASAVALTGGTPDYFVRGAELTGNADGQVGTVFFRYKIDGGNGADLTVMDNGGFVKVIRANSNVWYVQMLRADTTIVLALAGLTTVTAGGGWGDVLASWDLGNSVSHMYLNGKDDANETVNSNDTIDYTKANWWVGANAVGAAPFYGFLSELYFAQEYVDLSVQGNRDAFRLKSLGPDGSYPTGTAPIIYMFNKGGAPEVNSGTGGDFTASGSPTIVSGPEVSSNLVVVPNGYYV